MMKSMRRSSSTNKKAERADEKTIRDLLARGVGEVIPRGLFVKKLRAGERMRIYLGVDPTGPDIHLGHAVILRTLRKLQDLGHEIILVLGGFTARIGDPTDRNAARKPMTTAEIAANARGYKKQAAMFLSFSSATDNAARMTDNAKWLAKLSFEDVVQLAHLFTVQQMLERDMFQQRIDDGKPIYIHEFLYPLMQGYDSVALNVDMELGGTDQLFNMLAGRTLQKFINNKEKIVMTHELLEGLDGRKMSKSYGNIVGIADTPEEMFGKIMSLDDKLILRYFLLCTDMPIPDIRGREKKLQRGANPRDVKMELATAITTMYHSEQKAKKAKAAFVRVFQKKDAPHDMVEFHAPSEVIGCVELLVKTHLASSKSEARRLIEQGGLRINGSKVTDVHARIALTNRAVIQVGKRKFVRITR